MHKAEDLLKNFLVVWLGLELDHLAIDDGKALAGLGQKISEKVIHMSPDVQDRMQSGVKSPWA